MPSWDLLTRFLKIFARLTEIHLRITLTSFSVTPSISAPISTRNESRNHQKSSINHSTYGLSRRSGDETSKTENQFELQQMCLALCELFNLFNFANKKSMTRSSMITFEKRIFGNFINFPEIFQHSKDLFIQQVFAEYRNDMQTNLWDFRIIKNSKRVRSKLSHNFLSFFRIRKKIF